MTELEQAQQRIKELQWIIEHERVAQRKVHEVFQGIEKVVSGGWKACLQTFGTRDRELSKIPGEFDVIKVAGISTGHYTKEDDDLLAKAVTDSDAPMEVVRFEFGFFVYVADCYEDMERYGFSEYFIAAIEKMRDGGFTWASFDCDGMKYKWLPYHEW